MTHCDGGSVAAGLEAYSACIERDRAVASSTISGRNCGNLELEENGELVCVCARYICWPSCAIVCACLVCSRFGALALCTSVDAGAVAVAVRLLKPSETFSFAMTALKCSRTFWLRTLPCMGEVLLRTRSEGKHSNCRGVWGVTFGEPSQLVIKSSVMIVSTSALDSAHCNDLLTESSLESPALHVLDIRHIGMPSVDKVIDSIASALPHAQMWWKDA